MSPKPLLIQDNRDSYRLHVGDLIAVEQLLVWALRQTARRSDAPLRIEQGFWSLCGLAMIERAIRAYEGLIDALISGARRPLRFGETYCSVVSADENAILSLVAACQADNTEHVDAVAAWLVRPQERPALLEAARDLGNALARSERWLPVRHCGREPGVAPVETPRAVRLHVTERH